MWHVTGWFGLRKDFCSWLLGRCPTLQEYGNVYIKRASVDTHERDRQEAAEHQRQQMLQLQRTKKTPPNDQVTTSAAVVLIIDTPDWLIFSCSDLIGCVTTPLDIAVKLATASLRLFVVNFVGVLSTITNTVTSVQRGLCADFSYALSIVLWKTGTGCV